MTLWYSFVRFSSLLSNCSLRHGQKVGTLEIMQRQALDHFPPIGKGRSFRKQTSTNFDSLSDISLVMRVTRLDHRININHFQYSTQVGIPLYFRFQIER